MQSLVKVAWVRTCRDFAVLFNQKVEQHIGEQPFTEVRLIFDSCDPQSLKKATRCRRNQACRSLYYRIEDNTITSDISFKEFLLNESTKRELTTYLAKKFLDHFSGRNIKPTTVAENILRYVNSSETIQHESSIVFNHDEADTLLIWQGIDFAKSTRPMQKFSLSLQILMISYYVCTMLRIFATRQG